MSSERRLKVVLCWHMHQPEYRDLRRGCFELPWTYLHAVKDYTDMAAHLEAAPAARAVVNFTPVLLEQLEDYEQQLTGFLERHEPLRDPLLEALDAPVFPAAIEHRLALVTSCLRANRERIIARFPDYRRLAQIADLVLQHRDTGGYLSNQFLADLVTWYHLGWLGESVRRSDARVAALIEQGHGFTLHQRRELLEVLAELIRGLRQRYAALADGGRVELSLSPYAHPMLPLLLSFEAARDALPEVRLPVLAAYPGGRERAAWHLERGIAVFERFFKRRPRGCWPSEGGVSDAALELLAGAGFRWAATGGEVLRNSLKGARREAAAEALCKPYRLPRSDIALFARDDVLSDLVGFSYSDWHAGDAVGDILHRLGEIAAGCRDPGQAVVSIVMDGENAWEFYPDNGFHFLSELYGRLSQDPRIMLTTFDEALNTLTPARVPHIVAGSWVYGTFSTWIGDEAKNRAWDVLGDAKRVYDQICASRAIDAALRERIDRQLAACEGSDWFWWLGDYNPAETVSDFERLFRLHVANLYEMLGEEPPQYLAQTLAHGRGAPARGGVMRPASAG